MVTFCVEDDCCDPDVDSDDDNDFNIDNIVFGVDDDDDEDSGVENDDNDDFCVDDDSGVDDRWW